MKVYFIFTSQLSKITIISSNIFSTWNVFLDKLRHAQMTTPGIRFILLISYKPQALSLSIFLTFSLSVWQRMRPIFCLSSPIGRRNNSTKALRGNSKVDCCRFQQVACGFSPALHLLLLHLGVLRRKMFLVSSLLCLWLWSAICT